MDNDALEEDTSSQIISITEEDDGDIVIEIMDDNIEKKSSKFNDNLSETLNSISLSSLAQDILDGINSDEDSRQEWVSDYTDGIQMLGLSLSSANKSDVSRQSVSTVRHPLLLQAVIRFQSAAGAELLPAAGPVKVNNSSDETEIGNQKAMQLQEDFNYYLTVTASEYYPDMRRGLFYLGYGGTIFKKVYHCPFRRRPVSECVYLPDLIISNDATDIQNALRVSHRSIMTPVAMRRMMISGAYRDVNISSPISNPTEIARSIGETQGINMDVKRTEDQPYTVYECYTFLDPSDYGLPEEGPEGLPLPYRVTIDKDSYTVLDIRRDWIEGDEGFLRKKTFVKYGLIPGLGFLDIGYLHLLGQQAKALTAIRRILIDAGMFSNFPGGVKIKGTRQTTNQINPSPGEWVEVDTGPMTDIRSAFMPLPYKEPSAVLMSLAEAIEEDAKGMAGAVEMEVGEGRTNIPVGTMMAMIEQQTQIMSAVHKGLHSSQQEEFLLLKERFKEDPESLTIGRKDIDRVYRTAEDLDVADFVPASDPNVPAQIHRIQQASAIKMLASQSPDLYDRRAVERRVLNMIGVSDADSLFAPPAPPSPQPEMSSPGVPPEILMADIQAKSQANEQKNMLDAQKAMLSAQIESAKMEQDKIISDEDRLSREKIASASEDTKRLKIMVDAHQKPAGGIMNDKIL